MDEIRNGLFNSGFPVAFCNLVTPLLPYSNIMPAPELTLARNYDMQLIIV